MFFEKHLLLEIDPVAKGRPKFARRGKFVATYTPAKTINFERALQSLVRAQYKQAPQEGALEVGIIFYIKRPKTCKNKLYPVVRPDIDNLLKAVLDSLNGILWVDDSQIVEIKAKKDYCNDRGFISLTLKGAF